MEADATLEIKLTVIGELQAGERANEMNGFCRATPQVVFWPPREHTHEHICSCRSSGWQLREQITLLT